MTYLERYLELIDKKEPFVEIVLVDARGSTPADAGSKALVTQSSLVWGTVGGGKVEAKAIKHAQELLQQTTKKNDFVVWNLKHDVGMTCGGEVKLYFDLHFVNAWQIAVFGAGHVSQSLVPLLCTLDCEVVCVDSRSEWLEKIPNHPKLKKLLLENPSSHVSQLSVTSDCILMTQGHATDFPILKELLLQEKGRFLGVIGSLSKKLVLQRELREAGIVDERKINSFECPIGLPIGNSSPAEISISIVSQLLMKRDFQNSSSKRGHIQVHFQNENSAPTEVS